MFKYAGYSSITYGHHIVPLLTMNYSFYNWNFFFMELTVRQACGLILLQPDAIGLLCYAMLSHFSRVRLCVTP